MTWAIVFRRGASADVDEIVAWYESKVEGLGKRFHESLKLTVDEIAWRPTSFPNVYKNARRALMPRFPYAVYFIMKDQRIEVLTVVHTHRHPGTWKGRV